jgi:hypothetical protein
LRAHGASMLAKRTGRNLPVGASDVAPHRKRYCSTRGAADEPSVHRCRRAIHIAVLSHGSPSKATRHFDTIPHIEQTVPVTAEHKAPSRGVWLCRQYALEVPLCLRGTSGSLRSSIAGRWWSILGDLDGKNDRSTLPTTYR